jgi:hypothetical protein
MLNWLTGNCELFGLPGQNWMLVVAGGLLLYIAVVVIGSFRQTASTSKNRRPVAAQPLAPSAACSISIVNPAAAPPPVRLVAMHHCAYRSP